MKKPIKKLVNYVVIGWFLTSILTNSAMAADEAKNFIQGVGDKVIAIVSDNKLSNNDKEKQLNTLFVKTVNTDWIAKFVAGRYLKEASPEQQKRYFSLYNEFLTRTYVLKFRQYTDQKMTINKVIEEGGGGYIIETSINDQDGKSYSVSYKVKIVEGNDFKIYDIIAEGISMITTQRSEFASILAREGMEALLTKLAKKG